MVDLRNRVKVTIMSEEENYDWSEEEENEWLEQTENEEWNEES